MVDPVRHDEAARPGYELRDISLRPVISIGIVILVALVFFAALVWWMYGAMAGYEARSSPAAHPLAAAQGRELPPQPRLQALPVDDLIALRHMETEQLGTYGWVDEQAGVVRIPIDRAMELVVERGLPARTGGGGQ